MKLYSDRRFCVYIYRNKITKDVIYIGNGTYQRPYVISNRHEDVIKLHKDGHLEIEIIFHALTKHEAETIEGEFLDEYLGVCKDGLRLLNKSKKGLTKDVSYSKMNSFFYYDESSPTFLRWKVDRNGTGRAIIMKSGDVAGNVSLSKNYSYVCLEYLRYSVHRIVYCLCSKQDVPNDKVIDHIDGDGTNNNISNLRLVTMQGNSQNVRRCEMQSNNKTGVVGVSINRCEGRSYYSAHLSFILNGNKVNNSKYFRISTYGEQEAFRLACEARKQFEAERDLELSTQTN